MWGKVKKETSIGNTREVLHRRHGNFKMPSIHQLSADERHKREQQAIKGKKSEETTNRPLLPV